MRKSQSYLTYMALAMACLAGSSAMAASYAIRVAVPGLKPVVAPSPPAPVGPFNYSTCGTTGNTGPTSCTAAYAGTALAGLVSVSNGIQTWTVPTTGTYTVTIAGASGGNASGGGNYTGGRGAVIQTNLALTQGTVLQLLVGQAGTNVQWSAGGGGASYIAAGTTPLAVAGGGGGANPNGGVQAKNASTTTALTTNGTWNGTNLGYSGGAGFAENNSYQSGTYGGQATGFGIAYSFLNGGVGASSLDEPISELASGGFGGGGGGGYANGGSGGGYSKSNISSGNGGNSYSSSTITSASATNVGAGYVRFVKQ